MNYDRLLALHHVCSAWHGGQWTDLYRLGCKVSRLMRPARSEEHAVTLDGPGYEEARHLYGVYSLALTPCKDESTYMPCAVDGCQDDNIIGKEWERGILRCESCRQNECDHNGCCCEDDS